jgi:hypothetical protein
MASRPNVLESVLVPDLLAAADVLANQAQS